MSQYRRAFTPGGIFFFTVVIHQGDRPEAFDHRGHGEDPFARVYEKLGVGNRTELILYAQNRGLV